jgi:hypothetical protein
MHPHPRARAWRGKAAIVMAGSGEIITREELDGRSIV